MKIELSREELCLICDALNTDWLDWNDKASLVDDKSVVKRSMHAIDVLSSKLHTILESEEVK